MGYKKGITTPPYALIYILERPLHTPTTCSYEGMAVREDVLEEN
jgi:hypothetical protein